MGGVKMITIKELYEWAIDTGNEELTICIRDDEMDTGLNYPNIEDSDIYSDTIILQ